MIVPLLVLHGAEAEGAQSQGRHASTSCSWSRPRRVGPAPKAPQQKASWFWFFRGVDIVLRAAEPLFPKRPRQRAIDSAVAWVTRAAQRRGRARRDLPGDGQQRDDVRRARLSGGPSAARDRPAVDREAAGGARRRGLLPALRLAGLGHRARLPRAARGRRRARASRRSASGLDWLVPLQVLDVEGDWAARRPDVRPGGWAFQYANPHYPDVDDTAVVAMAMDRAAGLERTNRFRCVDRARPGMDRRPAEHATAAGARSTPTTTYHYLNNIPFADHGALLDPPTEDVTARCVSMLAQLGETADKSPAVAAGDRLSAPHRSWRTGSWYGRWGMNYIYGTWSVLCALNAAGARSRRAGDCARRWRGSSRIQNPDGGWGEDGDQLQARLSRLRARRRARPRRPPGRCSA